MYHNSHSLGSLKVMQDVYITNRMKEYFLIEGCWAAGSAHGHELPPEALDRLPNIFRV